MALPQLDSPVFKITIPSSNEEVKFRPFLVKEEKILLIAIQEDDIGTLFEAVKQVIRNCTFNEVDVDKLTTYDLEYLFLQLRIKSKGPTVNLAFQCENEKTKEDGSKDVCGCTNEIQLNLEDVKLVGDTKGTRKIILEEKSQTGLIMKAPTFESSKMMQDVLLTNDVNGIYKALPAYIDTIFQGEQIFDDFKEEELQEWIEQLTDKQFSKIQEFFTEIPRLRAEIDVTCVSCGHNEKVPLEGLHNFLE